MVELNTEAPKRRKSLEGARFGVRVANGADGALLIGKLLGMAADARRMILFTRKADPSRVAIPAMAYQARELGMILVRMPEDRQLGRLGRRVRQGIDLIVPRAVGICRQRLESAGLCIGGRVFRRGGTGDKKVSKEERSDRHNDESDRVFRDGSG
jgi:hypothetical protein